MKIKNVSCTQFAGTHTRNVDFTDGINIVFGKNESGKSTLVNLISRTLFQSAKLDGRKDKEFVDLYFPVAKKGDIKGDFADGTITFEADDVNYKLSKEWSADPRCILSTEGSAVRTQSKIDEIVKDKLLYGEAVYRDILFSSQRNTDTALQTILDATAKSDSKKALAEAVALAFSETDGIASGTIEQAIDDKIKDIKGEHWDDVRQMPVDKKRWSKGVGEILKAYYALEDANAVLDRIYRLEKELDQASSNYKTKNLDYQKAKTALDSFRKFETELKLKSAKEASKKDKIKELEKLALVLSEWPAMTQRLEKARLLQTEKNNRDLWDKYESAKAIADEITNLLARLPAFCPEESEILQIKNTLREITRLENSLCGMNLNANVHMLGGNTVKITSLRTGKAVEISDGVAVLSEAVKITIPDVMEMVLAPANVDADAINKQLTALKTSVAEVLEKYSVSSAEEMETLARTFETINAGIDNAGDRLLLVTGGCSYEDLTAEAKALTLPIRTKAEIDKDIYVLCGSGDIARFVTVTDTTVKGFMRDYGCIDLLKATVANLEETIAGLNTQLAQTKDIPAEYRSINDPEAYLSVLNNKCELYESYRDAALNTKIAAASSLESFKEGLDGNPVENVEKAKRNFDEARTLLAHWIHIKEVFKAEKEKISNNPMQDVADRFSYYLSVITGGKVSSEFPEADKLNIDIYSDNKQIDYSKLSEGTKETVSLAFRLAVLDHLFPNGDGVIVFDDPFTDMDAERTAASCRLIKECAKRHQVIFLTCKEEYTEMLGGNVIPF